MGARFSPACDRQFHYSVAAGSISPDLGSPRNRRSNLPGAMSARSFLVFLAVAALIGLLAFGLLSKGTATIEVGDRVPDRPLPVLAAGGDGGRERAIADFRGAWVLVNLWASWCEPCREEAPALERFSRRYRGREVAVLGINVQDNSEDALAFMREFETSYPQLRSVGEERSDAFGSTGVPENFLVDPRGRLALIWRGPLDDELIREQVVPLVEARR
jgi:cytochrome c biogenesis protein CcmG/thiol:disulfide interchange protein DsbE